MPGPYLQDRRMGGMAFARRQIDTLTVSKLKFCLRQFYDVFAVPSLTVEIELMDSAGLINFCSTVLSTTAS